MSGESRDESAIKLMVKRSSLTDVLEYLERTSDSWILSPGNIDTIFSDIHFTTTHRSWDENVNCTLHSGSLLHRALIQNNLELTKFLLEKGASISDQATFSFYGTGNQNGLCYAYTMTPVEIVSRSPFASNPLCDLFDHL